MPLKQVPVLEVDGKTKIGQTTAILRYLANQFELAGKTPLEQAQVDMLGEFIQDTFLSIVKWILIVVEFETGDKDALFTNVVVPAFRYIGEVFVRFLRENDSGWLVGNNVTWVDFHAVEFFTRYDNETTLDVFPLIKAHIKRGFELPNVKKYTAKHPPETVF